MTFVPIKRRERVIGHAPSAVARRAKSPTLQRPDDGALLVRNSTSTTSSAARVVRRRSGLRRAAPVGADVVVPTAYRHSKLVYGLAVAFLIVMPFAEGIQWHGKINIDVGDLVYLPLLAGLVALAVRRPGEAATFWQEMPCRGLWCVYGIFAAGAYAQWSHEAGYLGAGSLYQFYRYSWKPMLIYPVVFYMAARPGGIQCVMAVILFTADVDAIVAIQQGRSGLDVRGVMSLFHKNMLAGSFLIPAFLALCEGMHNPRRFWRYCARGSAALIAVALWYAVSRGAMVGAAVGAAVYMLVSPKGWRVAALLLAVSAVVLVVRPDFGSSSGIMQRFTDIGNGTDSDNLAWRMRERWPHFTEIVSTHPLFGVGQAVDLTLGVDTNTPHNGYLALMVQSGIPAAVCYVLLLVNILVCAVKLTRSRLSPRVRGLGAAALAGVVAFCVHNFVETTFESGPAGYSVWIACGLVMALFVRQRQQAKSVPAAAVA